MKILGSIKSMSPPVTPTSPKEPIPLFGATKTISNTVHDFMVKRRSESSEQLRALLAHPENGELIDEAVGYKIGDVLVVGLGYFNRMSGKYQPHGMIVNILSTEPFECELLEMVSGGRNRTSTQIGHPIQTPSSSAHMYFMVSGQIDCDRIKAYIDRSMYSDGLFRVFVGWHEACTAFIDVVGMLETQRNKLSKRNFSESGFFYGTYNCNSLCFDTISRALKIRDSNAAVD